MSLFTPKRVSSRTSIKAPKLSSHLVKAVHFNMRSLKISAPRFSKGKAGKVKI